MSDLVSFPDTTIINGVVFRFVRGEMHPEDRRVTGVYINASDETVELTSAVAWRTSTEDKTFQIGS